MVILYFYCHCLSLVSIIHYFLSISYSDVLFHRFLGRSHKHLSHSTASIKFAKSGHFIMYPRHWTLCTSPTLVFLRIFFSSLECICFFFSVSARVIVSYTGLQIIHSVQFSNNITFYSILSKSIAHGQLMAFYLLPCQHKLFTYFNSTLRYARICVLDVLGKTF